MSGADRAMCRSLRRPGKCRVTPKVSKPRTARCAVKPAEFAEVRSRVRGLAPGCAGFINIVIRYMQEVPASLRYNPRHGITHPVGLSTIGGVALPDQTVFVLQRTGGERHGPGAETTSIDAR